MDILAFELVHLLWLILSEELKIGGVILLRINNQLSRKPNRRGLNIVDFMFLLVNLRYRGCLWSGYLKRVHAGLICI